MGLIARVLSFRRVTRNDAKISDVKVNPSGGDNLTVEHFADAGDDSHPLPTDYVHTEPQAGTGRASALGYADILNTPKAAAGEKRIYSREVNGSIVAEVWLKNDGEIETINALGYSKLRPDGVVEANGATIPLNGDVITASGISLDNHTHAQGNDGGGDSEQETEAPT